MITPEQHALAVAFRESHNEVKQRVEQMKKEHSRSLVPSPNTPLFDGHGRVMLDKSEFICTIQNDNFFIYKILTDKVTVFLQSEVTSLRNNSAIFEIMARTLQQATDLPFLECADAIRDACHRLKNEKETATW